MNMFVHVIDFNACLSYPCRNYGVCKKTVDGFKCKCSGNYDGTTCSGRYLLQFPERKRVHFTHTYTRYLCCVHALIRVRA